MNEDTITKEVKGKISLWRKDHKGFKLDDGNWYGVFKPFQDNEWAKWGNKPIKFKYTQKGDFNNILIETIEVLQDYPKDISDTIVEKAMGVSRDRLIVRQSCAKTLRFEPKTIEEGLAIAEKLEEWIFR